MNYNIHRFSLDLNGQDSMEYVSVRKGDTVKKLSVLLKESGTPYSITDGTTAVLAAEKADGTYMSESCTIEGNRLEVVLPASFTAAGGRLTACFKLSDGNGAALTSPTFLINVYLPAAEET